MNALVRTGFRRRPDSTLGHFVGKPRKCKICKYPILPPSLPTAVVCGLECAQALAPLLSAKLQKAKAARERKETRAKLEKLAQRIKVWKLNHDE